MKSSRRQKLLIYVFTYWLKQLRFQILHRNTLKVKNPFKVNGKYVNEDIVNFYATKSDKHGYPQFLVYENKTWAWISAKYFTPNL